jgi:hypothetical protein
VRLSDTLKTCPPDCRAAYLHLPVLCGIVEGGPTPGVSRDGGAHQQQPVYNGGVATPGCEVQSCGSLVIPHRQADVCEGDLGKRWAMTSHLRLPQVIPPRRGQGLRAEVGGDFGCVSWGGSTIPRKPLVPAVL